MNKLQTFSIFTNQILIWLIVAISGCATRYVDRDVDKVAATDAIGDVVIYKSAEEFKTRPPVCLGVMPLTAGKKEFEPTIDLRKALHAYLAPTGISLVPLQRIDQNIKSGIAETVNLKNVSAATACDTLMTGELIERQTRFWGVYSEVKMAADVRITRVSTGAVIWRAKHTAVIRDGGLPLNPISIIGGSISAGINIRDEQITRTTNDLARRLIIAIPYLKYTDKDSDLIAKPVLAPTESDKSQSVHAYISSIENHPLAELIQELTAALLDEKWSDPKDRLVLSDYLLKKDPQNTAAMFANATARLEISQPEESLVMVNRLIVLDSKDPDIQFLKGRALMQLNQPAQAIEPILKAAGSDKPRALYFTALGLAYNQLGNYEYALASLTRSLYIESDNPYALIQQATAYVGVGDEAEAAVTLKKSMVMSIIAKDHRNANRALSIFKSMNLTEQISPEELNALEIKIGSLLTTL